MSTIIDPAKLKVVELRAELSARGLDTKGNKPVLVKRLRDALEKESGTDLPDTSIADTTTEDLNTSAVSDPPSPPQSKQPDKELSPEPVPSSESPSEVKSTQEESESTEQVDKVPDKETSLEHSEVIEEEKMDVQESTENKEMKIETEDVDKETEQITTEETNTEDVEMKEEVEKEPATTEDKEEEVKEGDSAKPETQEADEKEEPANVEMVEEQKQEESGDSNNVQDNIEPEKESTEPRNRKSRWGAVSEPESQDSVSQPQSDCTSVLVTATTPTPSQSDVESRGEKRRHSSQSPDRVSRKRSRSPIREDEPSLDEHEVQLSWIDSDLNLEISKECFTSAEPLHYEGFGYMWAGVRSTHGINNGKVWYEVKLLENCEWNDTSLLKDPKDKEKSKESAKSDDKDREKDKEKSKDDTSKENKEDDSKDEEKPDDESETKEDKKDEDSDSKDEEKTECKVEKDEEKMDEGQEESKDEPAPEPVHILRVGWSLPSTVLQLGEEQHSYGFDSEGFAVCDSKFTEYGKKYEAGDVVGTFLDLQSDSVIITYTINGELQPAAFTVPRADLPEDSALFPHILTRNAKFAVNFGQLDEPWFKPPVELDGYTMLKDVEDKTQGRTRPEKREECEVLMMVGLPCSGKTHWATNHATQHPEKNYTVLGISTVLDKMKHLGKSRKDQFTGSRRTVLMDKCSRCLNKLIEVASVRRRNYILDQTNLFSSAQRRKMRPFEGFRRLAVVIVVADDEQTQREHTHQQADGKDVPDSAVLEMKASMCLPTVCDWLDEVTYAELDESKAKEIVQKYNKQGREAGYGPNYTAKHSNNQRNKSNNGDRRGQWSNRSTNRRDSRDSSRNNRWGGSGGGGGGGGGGSGDSRGHNRQNNWGGNRGSGNWGGRHDSRNQHHGGGGGGGGGGGYYRNNSNNRMMSGSSSGGGGYNRNQSSGSGGGGGYNRNRNQPPHRNQMANKGGSWGNQGSGGGGGGSWNNQGNWSNQGGWGSHQSSGQSSGTSAGWSQGSWNQYSGGQTSQGGGSQQWKSNYGTPQQQYQQQQQQQSYAQGYTAGQYTGQQYPNWNYYGQYAQGWNTQGQPSGGTSADGASAAQYNQYTQQQQAAWAQYAQSGYSGGYGQTATQQPGNAVTGTSSTQSTTK